MWSFFRLQPLTTNPAITLAAVLPGRLIAAARPDPFFNAVRQSAVRGALTAKEIFLGPQIGFPVIVCDRHSVSSKVSPAYTAYMSEKIFRFGSFENKNARKIILPSSAGIHRISDPYEFLLLNGLPDLF